MKTLCVSLETAKALKAAGWTKPTELVWVRWNKSQEYDVSKYAIFVSKDGTSNWDWLPAPTAEEALLELPDFINGDKHIMFQKHDRNWFVGYFHDPINAYKVICAKSPSEAAAQMWLWCVKEGHINTEVKP